MNQQNPISSSKDDVDLEDTRLWGSKRILVAMFMFICSFYAFMLRGNLSIAIIEMTSNKTTIIANQTITTTPEFRWDSTTEGWILSLYYYGSLLSPVGGYLSSKYGGVTIIGLGTLITGILTMASPMALRTNLYLFAVGRILEGVFENFAYTGICDVWSRWIPKTELPKVASFAHSGYFLGAAVTFPICGCIAQYYQWPIIFYFTGFIAITWSLLLLKYMSNDPQQDKGISEGELRYIKRTTELRDDKNITYPWRKIFTSKPVWALLCNKFAHSWTQTIIISCFSLYIRDITKKSTAVVGLLSGIPSYGNLFIGPISGLFIDFLLNNLGCDPSKLQKCIIAFNFLIEGALFCTVGFSSFITSMMVVVVISILNTVNFNVLQLMIVGISPQHAGFLAGISTLCGSLSSICGPLFVGFIVVHHTSQEWSYFFEVTGSMLIFAATITALFGSGEDQKWLSRQDKATNCNDS